MWLRSVQLHNGVGVRIEANILSTSAVCDILEQLLDKKMADLENDENILGYIILREDITWRKYLNR